MVSNLKSLLRNPWISWLLRLSFSGLLLALILTQVDLAGVFAGLRLGNAQWVLSGVVLYFAIRYIWAYRMSLGLKHVQIDFTIRRLLVIILISIFYSLVLPGSVITGGAVSWHKLSRSNHKRAEVGALLVYLRVVDTLTLLGIGLVWMWFDVHFSSSSFRVIVGMLFAGVFLISLPFLSPAVTRRVEQLGQPLVNRLSLPQWVRDKSGALWRVLKALQTLGKLDTGLIFGLSLVAHALGAVLFYLFALAIDMHISFLAIGWICSVISILQLIPFSVAGIGVREVSLVILLGEYGISEAQALTFSLAIFSMMVIGGLAGGVLEVWDILFSRHQMERPLAKNRVEWNEHDTK
jgi:uncharacterized protein (TIRG00374 family)